MHCSGFEVNNKPRDLPSALFFLKKKTGRLSFHSQTSVVQKVNSAIHRINHYPVDNTVGFSNAYPVDSDLSGE